MDAAKSFIRAGKRYRPGDPLPEDLDKPTLAHYQRHGMVREAAPSETKPAQPGRKQATPKQPKQVADPKPSETKAADDLVVSEEKPEVAGDSAAVPPDAAIVGT